MTDPKHVTGRAAAGPDLTSAPPHLGPAAHRTITELVTDEAPRLFALWECAGADEDPVDGRVRYWGIQIGDRSALLYPDGVLWGTSGSAEYASHGLSMISAERLVTVDVGGPDNSDGEGRP
ncbi:MULTISPECIES: hypothetical protein [Actinoalloteichus]|uniref:Uncharacterized protein n=1 Tax=Actinoalloteichus fjordicus TaxID=1612552 RepID=A0AAC9LB02_9PSEU|nr:MULTISPECIES: hypothetical protein [Actinoalloteichus]APU14473.1 hypothetical protein UA74_12065 [Actinoalloteichus fjordicus]APU20442.1 hypothetical protein UA75_12150 [Actinoalloteichus sp. GBA129-24]